MENLFSPEAIKKFKDSLLEQRAQVIDQLKELARKDSHESDNMVSVFPEYGDKPDENVQEISDYSTNVATEKVFEKSLEDVDKALERIENGTYGICKYCGNPIGEKRLMARPTASSCIKCKTELQENE
jgi:RNA polymerase-binding protein DksA